MPNSPAVVFPVCPECGGEERVNDLNDRVLQYREEIVGIEASLEALRNPIADEVRGVYRCRVSGHEYPMPASHQMVRNGAPALL